MCMFERVGKEGGEFLSVRMTQPVSSYLAELARRLSSDTGKYWENLNFWISRAHHPFNTPSTQLSLLVLES